MVSIKNTKYNVRQCNYLKDALEKLEYGELQFSREQKIEQNFKVLKK
jgi:hypothetical protein